jgi:tetratricopeptide (TPR) repeat protein
LILSSTRLRAATEALMANTARIEELKKKFDENPRRYFAPLANEFRKTGDVDHAILICEEFLPQQPGHMSGHIVYGQALFEAGKLPESRAVFETALSLDPENVIALRHLGDIARSHGDHAAARNWYVRVLDADPRNEEIQELIATLDDEFGKTEPVYASFDADTLPEEGEEVAFVDFSLADTAARGVPIVPSDDFSPSLDRPDFAPMGFDGGWALQSLDEPPVSETPHLAEQPEQKFTDFAPVELPPQVIAAEAELIDARETPAMPTPPSSQYRPLGDHDVLPYAGEPTQAAGETAPLELSAQVIAAEAELIDAGETPAPPAASETEEEPEELGARAPFVTETMAELYLAQGFREQARTVYLQLLAESPDDVRLSGLVSSLTPASVVENTGPNVRDFLARIAVRQPGMRSAAAAPPAQDDFTSPGFIAAEQTPPAESAVTTGNSGSIDALFGNRLPGALEDSAAAALAQAFRGDAIAPPEIAGRPAHAATGELSLNSVFRDGPARPSRTTESFSFDQFFTGGGERGKGETPPPKSTEVAMPTEPPAEHSADDIEQFNAWLQGLKQR